MSFWHKLSSNPYILMSVLLVLWGTQAAVSKLQYGGLDNFQLQFYIYGCSFVVLTLLLFREGKLKMLRQLSFGNYISLTVNAVPYFCYNLFYLLSLKLIPAVEASMLNYLFPVMIVLFAIPINREKLDKVKTASVALGFIGMLVIMTNGSFSMIKMTNLPGDLLAICAAVSWGVFSNLEKKNRVDPFISIYLYVFAAFVFSAACNLLFSTFVIPPRGNIPGILYLSITGTVASNIIWFRLLKAAPIALVASLTFLTPFTTLAFIMLLLGESITPVQILGLAAILGGVAVQSLEKFLAGRCPLVSRSRQR